MNITDPSQIKIHHVMADGTVRDSVEGYPVPVNEITLPAYNLIAKVAERLAKEQQKK